MPKVLRIINRLNLGGPTYNTSLLTKFMSSDFDTLLVSGLKLDSEESSDFIAKEYNIKPIYINDMHRSINIFKDYKAYKQLRKIIKDFKPDIVHTHAAKSGALGRLAAYHENIPIIIHTFHGHVFHSYFNKFKSFIFILIERFLAKISTKIIAISNLQKNELCKKYKICNSNKIMVIPLGFELKKFQLNKVKNRKIFRKKYQIKDDEIAIGIIGRLTAIKNQKYFLNAYKWLINNTEFKIRAFIIGDGEDRLMLEKFARDINLNFTTHVDKIHNKELCFTSWEKKIEIVNAGLDIVTLTSLNEGTPVSLIEAQAANNIVVSTNVGGISDIIIENKTGLLADKKDYHDFGKQLKKVIENESLKKTMSKSGYEFVKNKFNYKRLVNEMTELYKKLLIENETNKL
jgi:glycosyltransferase involved in cell wall biosynthesis